MGPTPQYARDGCSEGTSCMGTILHAREVSPPYMKSAVTATRAAAAMPGPVAVAPVVFTEPAVSVASTLTIVGEPAEAAAVAT